MTTNKLPQLPSLPSTRRPGAQRKCACGCERLTQRTFAPGHDARLKGGVIRHIAGMPIAEIAEIMGQAFADAVTATLANPARLRAWSIEYTAPAVQEEIAS